MNYVYLIKVEPDANNNKYYEMKDNEDGTFTAYYGRVGYDPQTSQYPISRWQTIYNQKTSSRKGYTDITHLRAKEDTAEQKDRLDTDSRIVKDIFNFLLASTKETVSKNYLLPVSGVTEAMVNEAQLILNDLVDNRDKMEWERFNKSLLDLFKVLPRQMRQVQDNLLYLYGDVLGLSAKIIQNEQDLLDSLKGQIVVVQNGNEVTSSQSLFDTLGIKVSDITPQDEQLIKRQLSDIRDMYYQAVSVTNLKTQKRYTEWLQNHSNQESMMLWHGSRHQNWISLLQKGLLLNPVGAIITGKMFGYGLYFAPRAKKSLGYTSYHNSYWAAGNSNRAYMGLFEVHVGNIKRYQTSQSSLTFDKVRQMGYDSVMGEKGYSLINDEIIVYNEAQTNIKYLVELR